MNKELVSQESNKTPPRPNVVRPARSLIGALVGVLFFTIILLLLKASSESPAYLALLFPGILAIDMFGLSGNANRFFTDSIAYVVSGLPSAILGLLIISKIKIHRNIGLVFLIIYLLFSLCYGLLLVLFMND
ncbi:MAG TPA: hypothetical protein VFY83_17900 [Anaerolineales bacterium]|jgi:hypothetical protein|nr:hypothetical protein [Anaerolineales bacterium]